MILRRSGSLLAALVLAFALTSCGEVGPLRRDSATPATSVEPTPIGRPSVAAAKRPVGPRSLTVMQKVWSGGKYRSLEVEADGRWTCEGCAGDGKTTSGRLTASQIEELQGLLADPALAEEHDLDRRYRLTCRGELISTLHSSPDIVSWQDCDGPPPITAAIVRLLAAATPMVPGTPDA